MDERIAVIGLGYVGLPVAMAFGQVQPIIGFDIAESRVGELKQGVDVTGAFDDTALQQSKVTFTSNTNDLREANFFIVTIPTPVDENQQPDLSQLVQACEILGGILKQNDLVVFESTVYPGTTQAIAVPMLNKCSKLKEGIDFYVGYSPERINPSDSEHTFVNTAKIIAAEDSAVLDRIEHTYQKVVLAPLHRVLSIQVAEAAKVVENIQRDVNIALFNELAMALKHMNIDSQEVFAAATTKWNFIPFKPGLVGGHCLGVDPFYFIFKSTQVGYTPNLIKLSRQINEGMVRYIAHHVRKLIIEANLHEADVQVGVLGVTYKENCVDIRNSKSIELIRELQAMGMTVQAHDSLAEQQRVQQCYGLTLVDLHELCDANLIILSVAHELYGKLTAKAFQEKFKKCKILIDITGTMPHAQLQEQGIIVWKL